jgi:hypothetical protein
MHDNHNTDLLTDWDLSQLRDDDEDDDDQDQEQQEYSGDLPW